MPNDFQFLASTEKPTEEILEILQQNVIGTPGQSMLYQHLGVLEKVTRIRQPTFVYLKSGQQLVGTCCFCYRTSYHLLKEIPSYYIRYFSFKERFRAKRILQKSVQRNSKLREEIKLLLEAKLFSNTPAAFFHYAYVDPRNIRSMALCHEFGFEKVRQYTTILFNRIFPRVSASVQELRAGEHADMERRLSDFYHDYAMFSSENLFGDRKYYVIRNELGEIMAGVQVNPDRWKIISLPGTAGKIILSLFSPLPILNRLLNKNYRFLALDGIFVATGGEKYLETLIESLLATHHIHTAIAVVDADSSLYQLLKSLDLGTADKLNKEFRGDIICSFQGLSPDEIRPFRSHPAYISTIDVT